MKKILIVCSLLLASCGFSPMYSDSTASVFIVPISGTNGVDLRNNLRAEFGHHDAQDAKYTLTVALNKPETIYKALQITGDSTWQEIRMTANYELKDTDGTVVSGGAYTASESYTFVRDLVAAQASYNNAVQSVIRELGKNIAIRVRAEVN